MNTREDFAMHSPAEQNVPVRGSSSQVDLLRSLLVSPEMEAVDELRGVLEELRSQIKDPERLISLLLPIITDILARKVSDAGSAVAKAIAPIIDSAILERTRQDRASVAEVIGPIITEALKKEIRVSPEEMASAFAPISASAIARQHARSPQAVAHDLAPIIGGAIKEQIRSERDAIVDALYPVIGSTIARYMSETLNNLIQTINAKIEQSLSGKGLLRKLRARLKGISEAELLLKESISFSVDAIFLIHKRSGLIIAQSQNPRARLVDSDLLSGMLTAIRSLFNESLVQSGKVSELDQIEYGQSKIVLEVAGYCYLAAVVDGVPSQEFVRTMRKTLAEIIEHTDATIQNYTGDSSAVPGAVGDKLNLLITYSLGTEPGRSRTPYPLFIAFGIGTLILLVSLAVWTYKDNQDKDVQIRTATALANSFPGDQIYVTVGRDELKLSGVVVNDYVRSQAERLAKSFAPSSTIRNQLTLVEQPPLSALTASSVKDVTSVLNEVEGVSLTAQFEHGDLSLRGTVENARLGVLVKKAYERLPGIRGINSDIEVRQPAVESRIYFDLGSSSLKRTEESKVMLLKRWLDRNPLVRLRIIGHNDQTGPDALNERLAQNRATTIQRTLVKAGIAGTRLEAAGGSANVPEAAPGQDGWAQRCVRFEIVDNSIGVPK